MPIHLYRKMSLLRLGSGDFDVISPLLCSVMKVSIAVVNFGPSGVVVLACAYKTTCALSDINSFTS